MLTEREQVAHLLRRFAFGASEAELDHYANQGLESAVRKLLDYEQVDEGFTLDPMSLRVGKNNQKLKIESVQEWWLMRMIATRTPLREKMTLFWHDHFATSAEKVTSSFMMLGQNQILREHATGSFYELLSAVSKDAAMMQWLDNQYNVKGKPNENFAREVMELFTMGIGNYSESDVSEAARAFTGWGVAIPRGAKQPKNAKPTRQVFADRSALHDFGEKVLLGRRGNFDGDDVIRMLCNMDQTSTFIAKKLWEWFAYPNPEPSLVGRLAALFRNSGLQLKALLQAMMTAPEFYSQRSVRALYKNPVDFTVSTLRQLGFGSAPVGEMPTRLQRGAATAARIATKGMGMTLMYPPDVAGWDGGSAWISSATMVERIRWASTLFGEAGVGLKNRTFTLDVDARPLFAACNSPEQKARRLCSIFDIELPPVRLKLLAQAAVKDSATSNETAAAISRLIFAAPEFQFA